MFKITDAVVEACLDQANFILKEVYPKYISPKIYSIKITNARSYWMNIGRLREAPDGYGLHISRTFEQIPNTQMARNRFVSSMIHELIHTQPKCMNHGRYFQYLCKLVNKAYPQYQIKTSTSSEEVGLVLENTRQPKYKIICQKCNQEYLYFRKLKYDISEYRCTHCGNEQLKMINL